MANYFVRTDEGVYYPAELALIKFNFEDGILSKYHQYLNPREFANCSARLYYFFALVHYQ